MVKYFASGDGLTVSSWIRREIDRAIRRRLPSPYTGFQLYIENRFANAESGDKPGSISQAAVGEDVDLNREVSFLADAVDA